MYISSLQYASDSFASLSIVLAASWTDQGIFLGYSSTKKGYRCYNKRLHKIVESADVRIDDIKPRRIRIHDGHVSTNDEEKEDLQKDESIHDVEEELEEEYT